MTSFPGQMEKGASAAKASALALERLACLKEYDGPLPPRGHWDYDKSKSIASRLRRFADAVDQELEKELDEVCGQDHDRDHVHADGVLICLLL